jgi:hypothetical protein
MKSQKSTKNWTGKILIFLVLINIIGDLGNIAFWWANPDSRAASLNTGIIAVAAGIDNALLAGTIILGIVALVYAVALAGLLKRQTWGPLLVIATSIINRVLAVFLYFLSPAFAFWGIWTIILVILAYLDFKKISSTLNSGQNTIQQESI